MKKLRYGRYIIYLFAVLVFMSCKKQLDQQPPDNIAEANAFQTLDHIQLGANEAYKAYGGSSRAFFGYPNDMYVSALLSDEAKLGAGNAGQGALEYRYQFSSDATTGADVTAAYLGYYAMIDHINRVLPHVYTVTATPAQEPRRDILQGQLLALRAIAHFGLLQAYCKNYNPSDPLGVPIMLVSDPLAKPPRNTVGEVMAQIDKDLSDAKALLPAVTPATFTDTVMNRINIAAYQARISLYKGDWDNAITYSSEVINSGIKPLVSGAAFNDIWTDDGFSETLFRVRFLTGNTIGSLWTTTGGTIYIAPSDKLVSTYDQANDIRYTAFIGYTSGGDPYVNKFYASARGGRVVDMKACRTAEMYLIRAEAYAKKSSPNLAAGAADLNTLRSMRISGYVDESFASASDLITAVLEERYKELCFEGFRFFDLKRNNLPVERNASDASPAWQTLAAGNYRFVMPIPAYELNANPNMVQNDGY